MAAEIEASAQEFNMEPVVPKSTNPKVCGPFTKAHLIIIASLILGGALVIGIFVGITERGGEATSVVQPLLPPVKMPAEERIDCYPEEHWASPPTKLSRGMCEARGCTYELHPDPAVPSCFVGEDSRLGAGYRVVGDLQETDYGFKVVLEPRDPGMYEELLTAITLKVEYRTTSAVRFKVGLKEY